MERTRTLGNCSEEGAADKNHDEYHPSGTEEGATANSVQWLEQRLDTILEEECGQVDLNWNGLNPSGSGCSIGREAVHNSSSEEGRNEAVPGEGVSNVSDDLHANGGSKRRCVAGKQRPASHDHANASVKRKAEAEVETQEERKMRRSMLLNEFKGDLSGKAKEDTGGGVWKALFPDEDQSEDNGSHAKDTTGLAGTSQGPEVNKFGPFATETSQGRG